MEGHYEFKKIEAFRGSLLSLLKGEGAQGWEAVEVAHNYDGHDVLLKRPSGGEPWEYIEFTFYGRTRPPREWEDHLKGCGWSFLFLRDLYVGEGFLYKRPGSYRGADDGDVLTRLSDLGYHRAPTWDVIGAVLKVKWEESQRRGHDIGTYEAVRHWLAHTVLPQLFADSGREMPGGQPQSLLDELLSLRAAEGITYLDGAVKRWCAMRLGD